MKAKIRTSIQFLIVFLFFASAMAVANDASVEIKIKTPTVQCGMCKKAIETSLSKLEGVVSSEVDYKKKETTVKYNKSKTNLDKIRKAISKTGYQADDVKADKKAYSKLAKCCKVPGKK